MTPEVIGLLEKLFALVTLIVLSYNAYLTAQVKKVVEPLPAAIDGQQDKMKELISEIARLKGENVGKAREQADQALRDTAPNLPVSSVAVTEEPVPVKIVADEDAPVPVAVIQKPGAGGQ